MSVIILAALFLSFFYFLFAEKRESKMWIGRLKIYNINRILTGSVILFVIVIGMSANRGIGDVAAFRSFYNYVKIYSGNPWDYTYELFAKVTDIFLTVAPEATFFEYHAILVFIIWIGIIFFYRKYIYCYNIVFFFYLLSGVFAHDGGQIKNFISVAFLICGLIFLLEDDIKNIILYYVFIVTATLFHFSFVIYIFLPIIKTRWFNVNKNNLPIIGGAIYVVLLLNGTVLTASLLRFLSYFPMMAKLNSYSSTYAGVRSLVPVAIYYIMLYVFYCLKFNLSELDAKKAKLFYVVYSIWILMGIFLPFLIYANAVYRFYRNLYIPISAIMSNVIVSIPRFAKRRIYLSCTVLIFVFAVFMYTIVMGQWKDAFLPIIQGDFFWK